jgi:predicted MFS family arabinose efflux permease
MLEQSAATKPGYSAVFKLALSNGLGISAAVISVTVSALAARHDGWEGGLASVPYGLQFLAILVATYPSAKLMTLFGRKPVFIGAALVGVLSGFCGYLAAIWSDPFLLSLAHVGLGVMLANVSFFRFAALEIAPPKQRATAMSLVVFGGTFAAILGPLLSRQAILSQNLFASAYLAISALAATVMILIATTPLTPPERKPPRFNTGDILATLQNPLLALGVASAAIGYGVMNLLMIAASLTLSRLGCSYQDISFSIQWHVLAMFFPSLFMGRLIQAIGAITVVLFGASLLIAASLASILDPTSISVINVALIMLGLGWNMTYVAGSYLVGASTPPHQALQIQAFNEFAIGSLAMLGAFLPGIVVSRLDWAGANLLAIFVTVPVLCIGVWINVASKRSKSAQNLSVGV